MKMYLSIDGTSRTAGFLALCEADFTGFYKFFTVILQVSSSVYIQYL